MESSPFWASPRARLQSLKRSWRDCAGRSRALGDSGSNGSGASARDGAAWVAALDATSATLREVDSGLRAQAGVRLLVDREELCREIEERVSAVGERLGELETALDAGRMLVVGRELERLNAALIRAKDASWAIAHDRLGLARRVRSLLPEAAATPA